jgi:PAS domain S-box-containing protein
LWEFIIEPNVSDWIVTDHNEETNIDKWRYVFSGTFFSALALIIPLILINQNISSRKNIEKALDKQNSDYESILNYAPAIIFYKDDKNNILRVNKLAADSIGLKPDEIEGKHTKEFYPEHFEQYYADDMEVIESGKPKLGIIEPFNLSTGETRWIQTDKIPIFDSSGKTIGILLFAIDITKQKVAEEKVIENSENLENLNQKLNDFVTFASHDLQEPLRKISIFSDRLTSRIQQEDEDSVLYLEKIQNASFRMKNLIDSLLKYSRVDSQLKTFETININQVVQNVLEDLETRILEMQGHVTVDDLPSVLGDPIQVYQLFLNLIGNSLKYHREGTPPVVNISSKKGGDGFLEISVVDNGIGIDEKHRDRVFIPFERLHGRSTYEGAGIGLAICSKIVSNLGGNISIKSNPEHGTTFLISFPEIKDINTI